MHLRQPIFPTVPRGQARAMNDQAIQIDGMEVQFDEKIALFPVNLDVVKQGENYAARPSKNPSSGRPNERTID